MVMHNNHEENIVAVTKMSLQFLTEAIGQCPAEIERRFQKKLSRKYP